MHGQNPCSSNPKWPEAQCPGGKRRRGGLARLGLKERGSVLISSPGRGRGSACGGGGTSRMTPLSTLPGPGGVSQSPAGPRRTGLLASGKHSRECSIASRPGGAHGGASGCGAWRGTRRGVRARCRAQGPTRLLPPRVLLPGGGGGSGTATMAGWVTGNRVRARERGDRRTYVSLLVARTRYPNPGGPENHCRPRSRRKRGCWQRNLVPHSGKGRA